MRSIIRTGMLLVQMRAPRRISASLHLPGRCGRFSLHLNMSSKLLVVLSVLGVFGAEPERSLFDGKTLSGWEVHGSPSWKVKDGALYCDGSAPSWLGTNDTFTNYVVTLEFRGPEKVNSGVFLRSQKEGQPHVTGYELQIWDYQPAGFLTGSLVGSLKSAPVKILP